MTNLISSRRRQWVTRGRVLVGLPIVFAVILTTSLVLLVVRPVVQDVRELERRRDSLLELQRNLPGLESRLDKETAALEQAKQQQLLLISLLAGRDKVQTFLALLNQQALVSGVSIQRYEPIKTSTSSSESQPPRSETASGTGSEQGDAADPLMALGYQKSSVALAVRGPYAGLQEFLQRMESLELMVESSDLEIKAAAQSNDDQDATAPVESRTELTIQLSFYDVQPYVDVISDNSKESPPR